MSQEPDDVRDNCSSHGDDASGIDTEPRVPVAEQDAHAGVKKVEAAQRVYGRYSRWCLFIGCVLVAVRASSTNKTAIDSIGLASYIYSLDASTTYAYLTFATSFFGKHSLISSITVAQSLIGNFCLSHRNHLLSVPSCCW
jgi:hypothetical protein